MNSLVKLVNPVMGLEDAAHLTTSHPLAKKKKEIEKKKRFRSFVRGDTIFVISNNRRSPRERERDWPIHTVERRYCGRAGITSRGV